MALDDILLAIEKHGEAECARIQAELEQTLATIRAEAKSLATDQRAQVFSQTETRLEDFRRTRLSQARRDARKVVRFALQSLIDEAMLRARTSLEKARERPEYPELLRQYILESFQAIHEDSVLFVDPRDFTIAQEVIGNLERKVEVRPELTCSGGVVAASLDGKVRVVNTLETRLEEAVRRHYSDFVRRFLQRTEESKWTEATNMVIPG